MVSKIGLTRHRQRDAIPLAAAAAMAFFTFAIYVRTLAPTITLRNNGADSGDLVTAAINLGVPHPTGYPLYTMLAHMFTLLPCAEPARRVNLLSSVAAAAATGIVFWLAYRLTLAHGRTAVLTAWTGAGLLAFGELLWSQAVIAEVHSLQALLVAILLGILLCGPATFRPYLLALVFGFALANHLAIVLWLGALWPYIPAARRWLTAQRCIGIGLCLLPGLLMYLYMPLRAGVHPVPNWGQASRLSGWLWLVSGAAYRHYLAAVPPAQLLQRLSAWTGIWLRELSVLGLALAFLGLWHGLETQRQFTLCELTYALLVSAYSMLYAPYDSYLYLLPLAIIVALWTASGAAEMTQGIAAWARSSRERLLAVDAAVVILCIMPLASIAARFHMLDCSRDYEAYRFATQVLDSADPGAIVLSNGDSETFPLWYVRYGLGRRSDVTVVDRSLLAFDWYRAEVAWQHPEWAGVVGAPDAGAAVAALLAQEGLRRPVHLLDSDTFLLQIAVWRREAHFFTLSR